ncbi:MAG: hypothetical protein JRI68_13755 [Deltaproteobacteria bacterium]|nr:hypothetical protein [Deltaproteobacteria bacterium]
MNKPLRLASVAAMVAAASLTMGTGCECYQNVDEQGNPETVCESLVRFEGELQTMQLTYTQGDDIVVDGVNGNIDIHRGGVADQVSVTFTPFSMRGHSFEEDAKKDLAEDLMLETDDQGRIFIKVGRAGGSSSGLGADMDIILPDGFTGGVNIDVGNGFLDADLSGGTPAFTTVKNTGAGDLDITGAGGPLDIRGDFDVAVTVADWSDQGGEIRSNGSLGELDVTVPAGANGYIQATCQDGEVTEPSSLPADWSVNEAAPNSKTINFGPEPENGGGVTVDAAKAVRVHAG